MLKNINFVSADEAVKVIQSGYHIHLSSVASAPQHLIHAMCRRGDRKEFHDVFIHHLHTEGGAPYADPKYNGIFFHQGFFMGANTRDSCAKGYADYIPVFLGETQRLYRQGYLPCDVVMLSVSPPDKHGYVSLGTSVDASLAAIEKAKYVIAEVNENVPRAWGDAMIPMEKIDIFVESHNPLIVAHFNKPTEIDKKIGANVASLIDDGACLQMGIGALPNAIFSNLGHLKNLGLHTEMFADSVLPLIEKGVINGEAKNIDKGKIVSTFLMGSTELYNFIDDNPMVSMRDIAYTNNPEVIAKNDNMIAINNALQIDLTGQVCADSLGEKMYSGVGGQLDYDTGASNSKGGKAIIAMSSVTKKGISKITPDLYLGAGVVTTRYHLHWFVTEYGIVDLYGKSLQERAYAIIKLAHPDHREELEKAAFKRFGPHFHYISNLYNK